jgi:hypothetical protein
MADCTKYEESGSIFVKGLERAPGAGGGVVNVN